MRSRQPSFFTRPYGTRTLHASIRRCDTPKKSAYLTFLEAQSQNENWTGDEPVEHAVLRMLVDKYKPLRTGTGVQSADEKLKKAPPPISNVPVNVFDTSKGPSTGAWSTEPLLPSSEAHRPWHTTFKVPSHETPSVRVGHSVAGRRNPEASNVSDERTRNLERQAKKRAEHAGRLMSARESTLDYRLGIRGSRMQAHGHGHAPKEPGAGRVNPTSMKGWASLVEERIEKARLAGLFKDVKGRGKPFERNMDEANPFIAREEFLLNRIVQRNGAAPPWVELQTELESALNSFRETIKQSWTRRALRTLAEPDPSIPAHLTPPPATLSGLSVSTPLRRAQAAWEAQERTYHDAAIANLNSVVRKYNGLAPYAVRRTLYTRKEELERMYSDAAPGIVEGLRARASQRGKSKPLVTGVGGEEDGGGAGGALGKNAISLGFMQRLRAILRRFLDRYSRRWVRQST